MANKKRTSCEAMKPPSKKQRAAGTAMSQQNVLEQLKAMKPPHEQVVDPVETDPPNPGVFPSGGVYQNQQRNKYWWQASLFAKFR